MKHGKKIQIMYRMIILTYFYNNKQDCLLVMRKMRQELNNIGLDEIEIMIRIQCGESKNVQKWGTQFWKLVDENVTPPEIYIGKNLPKYEEGLMK
ncbi:hypothetical protein CBF30_10760 [Vagococcus entomophilus]|uniref:Uncharacterized protein n=1 Tax=Vagococcus entomophilus TaxID=1160095 RepID=A0A430AF04_9ENTE|nr:hypothetical protein CBF30_10760 [Vagococcus entomophilus]